jgi:3-dehydroquinate synthase
MKEVLVSTGEKSYSAVIGESSLNQINGIVKKLGPDRIVLIASSRVYSLHRDYIEDSLDFFGECTTFLMEDSEKNKNYAYAGGFLEKFIESGLSRKSLVIAIGGGVVGDFAGYLAALYMRGIPVIQVPTTLLAMVDSSIGGKVAVNLSHGKNMAGAFHQPIMVASDIGFLKTLPEDELRNGLSEALKHGLLGDRETISILDANDLEGIRHTSVMEELVERSVAFKASVVSGDEKESGRRAILNFGHTTAHSVESLMEYSGISHGRAVAIGIVAAMKISRRMGWIEESDIELTEKLIEKYRLYDTISRLDLEKLVEHMKFDKKNYGGKIKFVLLKGVFNPEFNIEVNDKLLKEVLADIFV